MINSKKKGFTIVELVIVVAVIAILAAVLIPTFSNLVKKANISSDTVLAKNLNTALSLYEAENDVDTFEDALEGIKEYGYLIANLNAKTSGCFFVWEQETNQILLVDSRDNYKVLFSVKDGYGEPDDSWHFAISNKEIAAQVKADLSNVTIQQTIASIKDLNSWLEEGGTQVVYLDESLIIEESKPIKVNGGDITLNLGDSSLSTEGIIDSAPIFLEKGNLTIKGGTINANGIDTSEFGRFNVGVGYEPGTNLVVDGVNFIGITAINGTWKEDGALTMSIKDSTFNVSHSAIIVSSGSPDTVATIDNCNVNAGVNAISGSQGAKITVNGGTYVSKDRVIYSQDSDTLITINSGNFDGKLVVNNGKILINGGTFANTGLSLEDFKAFVATGHTVENVNGSYVVK